MRHVLQRHHDILQDYTQEFRKTSANLKARKEREDLLHSVRKDIEYVSFILSRSYIDRVFT